MMHTYLFPLFLLSACLPDITNLIVVINGDADADTDTDTDVETGDTAVDPLEVDDDNDGYSENDGDCNDGNAEVNPEASEVCNDLDDNCDGITDDDAIDQSIFYRDEDSDGYGVDSDTTEACDLPEGYASASDDCDDGNVNASPGLEESCGDFTDNDCDELIDEDVDEDGDGWTTCGGDCDDNNGSIKPGAVEKCDGYDNDCDGSVDVDAEDTQAYFADTDGDLFGDANVSEEACSAPSGYVADDTDCDDTDASINPSGAEVCNSKDDDCNDSVDDDASDSTTWYADTDHDRFGDVSTSVESCEAPTDYVADASDCNDTDASINPDTAEVCDGIDQNCVDGITDEGVDGDGDGETSCEGDCADGNSAINTSASESCNGIDDDCDGAVDQDLPTVTVYYDYDLDSYGDANTVSTACSAPSGYVADSSDCNDADALINPTATEMCDRVDNDCDGSIDVSASDESVWYADLDTDGYGDSGDSLVACDQPSGYVADSTDCDDSVATIYLGATESCNNIDDDCDGTIPTDEIDADADGYATCESDCDDADNRAYPSATEVSDGLDNDCDSKIDEGFASYDDDGDCYCETAPCTGSANSSCASLAGGDCSDSTTSISPSEVEICDYVDADCDGVVDDGVTPTWYYDNDLDGYGDDHYTSNRCSAPAGYISTSGDCDDANDDVNPGVSEDLSSGLTCYDGVDNDCDASASSATGEEWDFGDDDCAYDIDGDSVLDQAIGPSILGGMGPFTDYPTGFSTDDGWTAYDTVGAPTGFDPRETVATGQSLTDTDPQGDAFCAVLTGTSGAYVIAFAGESDETSAIDWKFAWLEGSHVSTSAIDLTPSSVYGSNADFTMDTDWGGFEHSYSAGDSTMYLCFGFDTGDATVANVTVRPI